MPQNATIQYVTAGSINYGHQAILVRRALGSHTTWVSFFFQPTVVTRAHVVMRGEKAFIDKDDIAQVTQEKAMCEIMHHALFVAYYNEQIPHKDFMRTVGILTDLTNNVK